MGGLGVLLSAGGSPGHELESKLSLQRDTHTPAPWERGTLSKHNCQTCFFLLSSWAWSISPFFFLTETSSSHKKEPFLVPAAFGSALNVPRQLPE